MAAGRSGTGPFSKFQKGVDYKLVGGRIHKNDAQALSDRLKAEGVSYTSWLQATVEAYLNSDPAIVRIVQDWVRRNTVKPSQKGSFTFSPRERQKIEAMINDGGESEDDSEAV